MCGGFTCSKNALIALNILYVVSGKTTTIVEAVATNDWGNHKTVIHIHTPFGNAKWRCYVRGSYTYDFLRPHKRMLKTDFGISFVLLFKASNIVKGFIISISFYVRFCCCYIHPFLKIEIRVSLFQQYLRLYGFTLFCFFLTVDRYVHIFIYTHVCSTSHAYILGISF